MAAEGATLKEIARRIGTNPRHVKAYLERNGVPVDTRSACERHHDKIVRWAAENVSLSEIARRIGTKNQCVRAHLTKHNIPFDRQRNVGEWNSAWNGGRIRDKRGYVLIHMPDHPYSNSNGYIREHRLVMERHLKRYLLPHEVVHHRNDNPSDNRLRNLRLYSSNGEHLSDTRTGKVPQWSPEGEKRIREAVRRARHKIAAANRARDQRLHEQKSQEKTGLIAS